MFEDKKIKTLEKRIEKLVTENRELEKSNNELIRQIEKMKSIVAAAEKYSDEHRAAMSVLDDARIQYQKAYNELMLLRKEFIKKSEVILDDIKP